jgi:drug/metabolite transporter (DMT)-like permease
MISKPARPAITPSHLKGVLLTLASAASISVTFIASKQAMRELSPLAFTPIWFVAASVWGVGFYLLRRGLTWPTGLRRSFRPILWLGFLNGTANLLLFTAINLGDPTLSSFNSDLFTFPDTIFGSRLGMNQRPRVGMTIPEFFKPAVG